MSNDFKIYTARICADSFGSVSHARSGTRFKVLWAKEVNHQENTVRDVWKCFEIVEEPEHSFYRPHDTAYCRVQEIEWDESALDKFLVFDITYNGVNV